MANKQVRYLQLLSDLLCFASHPGSLSFSGSRQAAEGLHKVHQKASSIAVLLHKGNLALSDLGWSHPSGTDLCDHEPTTADHRTAGQSDSSSS